MSGSARRQGAPASPRGSASVAVEDRGPRSEGAFCTCCEPKNPLVMRPDFGILGDGSAEFALCVLHEPEPTVYRNRGDGLYEQASDLSLNASGEIVDANGNVVATVASTGFQRLSTVDDDDPPPPDPGGGPAPERGPSGGANRPVPHHVDLSQDDFYAHRARITL